MVRRAHGNHRLLVDRGRDQIGIRIWVVSEPERNIATPDQRAHLGAECRPQPQIDGRVDFADIAASTPAQVQPAPNAISATAAPTPRDTIRVVRRGSRARRPSSLVVLISVVTANPVRQASGADGTPPLTAHVAAPRAPESAVPRCSRRAPAGSSRPVGWLRSDLSPRRGKTRRAAPWFRRRGRR